MRRERKRLIVIVVIVVAMEVMVVGGGPLSMSPDLLRHGSSRSARARERNKTKQEEAKTGEPSSMELRRST